MIDNLINLGIYLLIYGASAAISIGIAVGLFAVADRVEKIPNFLRWLLAPFFAILFFGSITAAIRSTIAILAIFWPEIDVGGNIWFYSNIVIPAASSYLFLWGCYMMIPSDKFIGTLCYGVLWSSVYVFLIYFTITENYIFTGDYLLELFDIGNGFWGSLIAGLCYLGGAGFALMNAWNDDF